MMNKQFIRFGVLLFIAVSSITAGSGTLYAQAAISLDEAIRAGAGEIEAKLTRGVKVVVLNFRSPSQRLSDYILDELMTELVRSGKLTVVDRANLELIQSEMSFQMSGEVSDSSAQAIGQKLGAQSIISGNIEDLGANYRIRFRTIEVETAAIQVLSSYNVQKDARIATLMGGSGSTPVTANPATPVNPGATQYPNGLNFSTGRKVGAGFLNLIYGIGSFTMGDWVGGLIVGGLELVGGVFIIKGFIGYEEYDDYWGYSEWYPDYTSMLIGMGISLVGEITGFVRPFNYDKRLARKNGTYYSFENGNPLHHITFTPVSAKSGMGMGVFYNVSY